MNVDGKTDLSGSWTCYAGDLPEEEKEEVIDTDLEEKIKNVMEICGIGREEAMKHLKQHKNNVEEVVNAMFVETNGEQNLIIFLLDEVALRALIVQHHISSSSFLFLFDMC